VEAKVVRSPILIPIGNIMALSFNDLEALVTSGCQVPGCKHETHGEIWLHGRCHINDRLRLGYRPGVLIINCADCFRQVTMVAVTGITEVPKNTCHPDADYHVRYRRMSGLLEIFCAECENNLANIRISRL
jgi:hypothetical protein